MISELKLQIGKNGLTEGVINSLNSNLKIHTQLRISVLKSASRNKKDIQEMAENIKKRIAYECIYRIIGFTIILRRQSKKQK